MRIGWVGCTAMLCGLFGTGIVATTVSMAGSMTETTFESWLAV